MYEMILLIMMKWVLFKGRFRAKQNYIGFNATKEYQ